VLTVRLSTKGQVVIPKEIREKLDLHEGDLLLMKIEGKALILRKVRERSWRRRYPIAYADAFAAATAEVERCPLLTGDPEFEALENAPT